MKLTKQTALKAALLAVLAANVSWEKMDFQSMQLASEVKDAKTAGAAPSSGSGDGRVSSTPSEIGVRVSGDAPPVLKLSQPSHEGELRICGELYKVQYQQISRGNDQLTEITATRPSRSNDSAVAITWKQDLINTIVKKSEADNVLIAAVKAHRTIKKEACSDSSKEAADAKTEKDKAEQDEEKKRLADGLKNCTLDRKGEPLKGSQTKLDCWLDQLNNVGRRIGKHKSEESESKAVLAEIQRIVRGPFKRLLKDALLSDDEGRAEHAKDVATDAMDTLEDLGAQYDLGRSRDGRNGRYNNAISKLIGEISALKHGAETRHQSENYADRAKEVRDSLRSARADYGASQAMRDQAYQAAMRTPLDPFAQQAYWDANQQLLNSQSNMNSLLGQYEALRMEIGTNFEPTYIRPLRSMQNAGLVSASDFNDFTKSYADLQKLLREARSSSNPNSQVQNSRSNGFNGPIRDTVLGADYAVPTDLAAVRSINQPAPRNGSPAPTRINGLPSAPPQLNFPAPRSIFSNP